MQDQRYGVEGRSARSRSRDGGARFCRRSGAAGRWRPGTRCRGRGRPRAGRRRPCRRPPTAARRRRAAGARRARRGRARTPTGSGWRPHGRISCRSPPRVAELDEKRQTNSAERPARERTRACSRARVPSTLAARTRRAASRVESVTACRCAVPAAVHDAVDGAQRGRQRAEYLDEGVLVGDVGAAADDHPSVLTEPRAQVSSAGLRASGRAGECSRGSRGPGAPRRGGRGRRRRR